MKPLLNRIAVAAGLALGVIVSADAVSPNTILVVDATNGVITVDPATGSQSILSSGNLFKYPSGIAVAPDRKSVLVTDRVAFLRKGAVFRVDIATGQQTIVSQGGEFTVDPIGIIITSQGVIYITASNYRGNAGAILRVDPSSGAQVLVSSDNALVDPIHLALDASGNLIAADQTFFIGGVDSGRVIRIDPITGTQTVISQAQYFHEPTGVAVSANNDIFVTDSLRGAVIKINPSSGLQTIVSSGGHLGNPYSITIDANGALLVANSTLWGGAPPNAVVRIDPVTVTQTVVSSNGYFKRLLAITTVPPMTPPTILRQPQHQTARLGTNIIFSVVAAGVQPLTYQWTFNGNNIAGAVSPNLTRNNVQLANQGNYSVRVSNPFGSVSSAVATLAVLGEQWTDPGLSPPAYATIAPKDKDNVVVVTHGWNPTFKALPDDIPWVDDLVDAIDSYLIDHGVNGWQVLPFKWIEKSYTRDPETAAYNAQQEGANLGNEILRQGWNKVHLIGHSAGSALIQAAADVIKAQPDGMTVVHTTFLDPYVRTDYSGLESYGKSADWSDCYFAHDFATDDLGKFINKASLTEGPLTNAFNVDVTSLDPQADVIPVICSTQLQPLGVCGLEVSSRHDWPHTFYANTILPATQQGSEGLGFPLSAEANGSDAWTTNHPGSTIRVLGNLSTVVARNVFSPLMTVPLKIAGLPTVVSKAEAFLVNDFQFTATTASVQAALETAKIGSIQAANPLTTQVQSSPEWIAFGVTTTNLINLLQFDATFAGNPGARGLLAVYWNTNLIGSIDESVTLAGSKRYMFALPEEVQSGAYVLSFRFTSFTNVSSTVVVTNITTGLSAGDEAVSLHAATTNGMPVITLTGPVGYSWLLQESTNLINWSILATVLNTNGVARFTDADATNHLQRFYRAVIP